MPGYGAKIEDIFLGKNPEIPERLDIIRCDAIGADIPC